jgi:hypothetical protein
VLYAWHCLPDKDQTISYKYKTKSALYRWNIRRDPNVPLIKIDYCTRFNAHLNSIQNLMKVCSVKSSACWRNLQINSEFFPHLFGNDQQKIDETLQLISDLSMSGTQTQWQLTCYSKDLFLFIDKIHFIANSIIDLTQHTEIEEALFSFDNIKTMQNKSAELQKLISVKLLPFFNPEAIFYKLLAASNSYSHLEKLQLLLGKNSKDFNKLSNENKVLAHQYLTEQMKSLFKIKSYAYLWLTKNSEGDNYEIDLVSNNNSSSKRYLKIDLENNRLVCRSSLLTNSSTETAFIEKNIDEKNIWVSEDEIDLIKGVSRLLKENNLTSSNIQFIKSAKDAIYKAFKQSILINRDGTLNELRNFILMEQTDTNFNFHNDEFKIELSFLTENEYKLKKNTCKYKFNIHPDEKALATQADFFKNMAMVIANAKLYAENDFKDKNEKFINIKDVIHLVAEDCNVLRSSSSHNKENLGNSVSSNFKIKR